MFLNMYSEKIFRQTLDNITAGVIINGKPINNYTYTDDTVLIGTNRKNLQMILKRNKKINLIELFTEYFQLIFITDTLESAINHMINIC